MIFPSERSQATRLKCVLPAVCQHYAGRCAHERSSADDDRADRKQNGLKKATADVLVNVEKGNTLADSMASIPDIFPPMLVKYGGGR